MIIFTITFWLQIHFFAIFPPLLVAWFIFTGPLVNWKYKSCSWIKKTKHNRTHSIRYIDSILNRIISMNFIANDIMPFSVLSFHVFGFYNSTTCQKSATSLVLKGMKEGPAKRGCHWSLSRDQILVETKGSAMTLFTINTTRPVQLTINQHWFR